ncbi:MAG: protein kinase [Ignavibacteria bacterium]
MVGTTINNYKFIAELGQGGMGVIYKAYDTKLDRYVAIKILKARSVNQTLFNERFKREAKNQAKLSHHNIVPVYGFIEEDDILGIVMELIDGETLEQIIERKVKLDIFEAMYIVRQALYGIGYAHSRGFIHRDIKPSNIIINRDGITKIMDFGISKSIVDKGVTQTGTNVGTLLYMSPEQIRGEDITVQSDIYSLGVTLFEMLAGVPPFYYETEYKVIEGHLKENPPDITLLSPGLPANIKRIIEKAMDKKPQNRYASYEEFLNDIKKLETEINRYHLVAPDSAKRDKKSYKLKSLLYTFLIFTALGSLVYFTFDQVNELWKSGINPLVIKFKKTVSGENFGREDVKKIKWTLIQSGIKNKLNSIIFIDGMSGFTCGEDGTLLKTSDAGRSWRKIVTPAELEILSISFSKNGHGYMLDEASLYVTNDFGENWVKSGINNFGKKFLKVKFIDSFTGFIIGSQGLALKTADAGVTWYPVKVNTQNLLCDIEFTDSRNGFIVGFSGDIFRTDDSGDTWRRINPFTSNYLKSIEFVDASTGFSVGGGGEIFKTVNGGQSWDKVKSDYSFGLHCIKFVDETTGYIIGSQSKVLVTSDGGLTWEPADANVIISLNSLFVTVDKKLFAVGVNGTILKL